MKQSSTFFTEETKTLLPTFRNYSEYKAYIKSLDAVHVLELKQAFKTSRLEIEALNKKNLSELNDIRANCGLLALKRYPDDGPSGHSWSIFHCCLGDDDLT